MIAFTIYGDAKPAGSKRAFALRKNGQLTGRVAVTDANKNSRSWKQQVAHAASEAYRGELLRGPLSLTVRFYRVRPGGHYGKSGLNGKGRSTPYPITKPDTTKLLRGVEDVLTGIVWADDAQVCVQLVTKHYGEPARCEVVIEELVAEQVERERVG